MASCIADKHAMFAMIGKFTAKFLGAVCDTNLAKDLERFQIWRVALVKQLEGRISSSFCCQVFQFCCSVCTFSPETLVEVFIFCDEPSQVQHCPDPSK